MSEVRAPGRLNRTLAGAARRLGERTTLLGLIVLAVGLFLGYIAWISINGVPFQDRYRFAAVIPHDSPIVKEGDAVRIAGRLAGFVVEVEPHRDDVRVEMEIEPGFAPIGSDARANVRVRSLVYLTYVEVLPGDRSQPLPEGGTIPLARTGSGVDLLEVVQLFDEEARDALRRTTYNTGVGLAGRGDELNAALRDLPATTRDLTAQLEAATATPGALARGIAGLARVVRGARGLRADDVAAGIASGSALFATVAGRATELGRAVELLRPVADELLATAPHADAVLADAAALSRELEPAVAELAAALPDVNRTLAMGDFLRIQTARLTAQIDPVLVKAAPILRALRLTVASLGPLSRPLDLLVDTLDPYQRDIRLTGIGLRRTMTKRFPEGATAPNNPALRFSPVLTCHNNRVPYPEPGEPAGHSAPC